MLKLVIEESVEGKNHRGRPRSEYIQQIIKDQGCDLYIKMKRKSDNREEWKMQTNPRNETIERDMPIVIVTYGYFISNQFGFIYMGVFKCFKQHESNVLPSIFIS